MSNEITIYNFFHLKNSKALLNQFEELTEIGFCYINYYTKKTYISDTVFNLLNIPQRAKVLEMKEVIRFVKKEERGHFIRYFYTLLPQKSSLKGEYTIVTDPESEHIVSLHAHTFFDNRKKPIYTIATIKDITKGTLERKELNVTNEVLRKVFESARVGILMIDAATKELKASNPCMCEMLGYSQHELLHKKVFDIHPEASWPQVKEIITKQIAGKIKAGRNIPVLRKDGSIFYADITSEIITIDNTLHLVGVFTDISKELEFKALKASDLQLRAIFDETQTGIMIADAKTTAFRSVNSSICKLLGYSAEELIKLSIFDVHPSYAMEEIITQFELMIQEKSKYLYDVPMLCKDGSIIDVNISAKHMMINNEELMLGFITDIREQKELQQRIKEEKEANEVLNTTIEMQNSEREFLYKHVDTVTSILTDKMELEEKFEALLHEMLKIFNVERTWFYKYGQDGKSTNKSIYYQVAEKGYEAANVDVIALAKDALNIEVLNLSKEAGAPLQIDRSYIQGEVPEWIDLLQIQSSTIVTIWPKEDEPWVLGMHQCKKFVPFTEVELKLFNMISHRMEGVFAQLLLTQDLQEDIKKRRKTEKELRASQEKLKLAATVFSNTDEGVIITDKESRIQEVNEAFTTITGYTYSDVVGKNMSILASHKHSKSFWKDFWNMINKNGCFTGEVVNKRKDGTPYTQWLTVSNVIGENGEVTGYVALFSDISEMKKTHEKLQHYAHHDPLTNLPNRVLFSNRITHAIQRATRFKQHFAVIFLDLDHFKDINDTLGHDMGDKLLKSVAKRIENCIRIDDTLARIGGDEFLILVENIKNDIDVVQVVEKIKNALHPKFILNNQILHITASMGVALYPKDGNEVDTLLKNADTAMYASKKKGRDGYSFYTEAFTQEAIKRIRIENAMREALDSDMFNLYYQPQFDHSTGEITGLEALIRWEHPTLGVLSPDKFIPLAEDCGLIIELGRWVMNAAFKQASIWQKNHIDFKKIAINVSGQQVWNTPLYDELKRHLKEYKLSGDCIEVEVTECFIMREIDKGIEELKAIRDLGVGIAIDDFGTGYSSLSYLKNLPITKLKIDKSFIDNVPDERESVAITKTIISLAKNLDLEIIAEGVETKAQLDFLVKEGCELIQGYYYSKPLPVEDMTIFLKKNMLPRQIIKCFQI
jgi:diguanylate cyclase (GGDEF)-like protein/PAS domain S-box-containing protein